MFLSLLQQQQTSTMDGVVHPGPDDILSGRGPTIYNHEGNRRFRRIVEKNTDLYRMLPDKALKSNLVDKIVAMLRNKGCRFLKKDRATGLWSDIGFKGAREKVGHSLRDFCERYGKRQSSSALAAAKQKQHLEDIIASCQKQQKKCDAVSAKKRQEKKAHKPQTPVVETYSVEIQNLQTQQDQKEEEIDLSYICLEVLGLLECDNQCDDDDIASVQSLGDTSSRSLQDSSLEDSSLDSLFEDDSKEGFTFDDFTPLEFVPSPPSVTPEPSVKTDALVVDDAWYMNGFITVGDM